jgi:hypothetical protein
MPNTNSTLQRLIDLRDELLLHENDCESVEEFIESLEELNEEITLLSDHLLEDDSQKA